MTSKENQASTDFSTLALSPATLANLQQLGYTTMTPIQAASLPPALLGKDLIAQASTGSGKTAAFALALLANLNPRRFAVQALVLCPTRELADQVTAEIRRLARAEENIKVVTLCGGVPLRGQMLSLEHGAHIVVGTPGRVMDLMERGKLDISNLKTLVLDEAEGYAFLKSRPEPDEDDSSPRLPRLIARRPLSFPVSLMLALLRRKLAESDANGDETRVIMTRDELVDLVRVFIPEGTNEARQIDQIETTLNKVVELGFLHKLKPAAGSTAQPANYEVKRILKAFVDAQWLADFDARLASYKETLSTGAHAGSAALRKNTPQEAP